MPKMDAVEQSDRLGRAVQYASLAREIIRCGVDTMPRSELHALIRVAHVNLGLVLDALAAEMFARGITPRPMGVPSDD